MPMPCFGGGAGSRGVTDPEDIAFVITYAAEQMAAEGHYRVDRGRLQQHFGLSCNPNDCEGRHELRERCPDDWGNGSRQQAFGHLSSLGMNKGQARRHATPVLEALKM